MIVEMHDIQAYQYAIQQKRAVSDEEVLEEINELAKFDHIVSISCSEANTVKKFCGDSKVTWCMPYVKSSPVALSREWTHDVLFIGSSHDANIASLHWFMQSVYETLLYPQGVTLKIIGTAGASIDSERYGGAVEIAGRVDELASHYELCGVVALPVIAGAGVPIKVLDAMAHGAPFVLMDFPADALGLSNDIPLARSAQDMADQILACLADPVERQRRSELGLSFARAKASPENYFTVWERIVSQVVDRSK